jgi:hypothetical protein
LVRPLKLPELPKSLFKAIRAPYEPRLIRFYKRLYHDYDGCDMALELQIKIDNWSRVNLKGRKLKDLT